MRSRGVRVEHAVPEVPRFDDEVVPALGHLDLSRWNDLG